jgi:hypothetical protein
MKTTEIRTLEELWDIEDQHPLRDPNPAGLLRWMYSTGMVPKTFRRRQNAPRKAAASNRLRRRRSL